eukprot:IDg10026t1
MYVSACLTSPSCTRIPNAREIRNSLFASQETPVMSGTHSFTAQGLASHKLFKNDPSQDLPWNDDRRGVSTYCVGIEKELERKLS